MAKDKAAEVLRILRKELSELEAQALRMQARMSAVREALRVLEGAGDLPNASQGPSTELSGASDAGGVHHRKGAKMSDATKEQMRISAEARWQRVRDRKAAELAARGEAEGGVEAGGEG
jgi:hypothetical protein